MTRLATVFARRSRKSSPEVLLPTSSKDLLPRRSVARLAAAKSPSQRSPRGPTEQTIWKQDVYIGIDPDVSGAVGVLTICGKEDARRAEVKVYDMPYDIQTVNKRNRRRLKADAVIAIVEELTEADGKLLACLESPAVSPVNGVISHQLSGYMYGFWHGALLAHGVDVEVVTPQRWKRDLLLFSKRKEGSLELARVLFPSAEDLLKRKKDHGRAEALLLAAWRAGFRRQEDQDQTFDEAFARLECVEDRTS